MQLLPFIVRGLRIATLPAARALEGEQSRRAVSAASATARAEPRRGAFGMPPGDAGFDVTTWPETQPCLYP